jgi:hypothetical protein
MFFLFKKHRSIANPEIELCAQDTDSLLTFKDV